MRNQLLLTIISSATLVFQAHAATYYVCDCQQGANANCVNGDDNAAGQSASTPWRTFDKAMQKFGSLPAGDTVAFARGASFSTAGGRWVNFNSTAGRPMIITAYTPSWASGSQAKPIIRSSGDCFKLENGGNARHKEGMVIEKLHLIGPGGEKWAFFLYNDIDDVVIDSMQIDSFSIGVHLAGANPPDSGSNGLNERITLKNSSITHCSGMGFLGSAPDLLIQNCLFDDNGYAEAVYNHNVYISGEGVRERVVGNVLKHSAMVDGQCQGVSLVVHGVHHDLIIEDNTIEEDSGAAGGGCYGIAVDAGYGTPEVFRNVKIRRNLVVNVGYIGIGVSSCVNCLIENNIIFQNQRSGGTGIAAPDRDFSAEDTASDSITVRNNTVHFGADVSEATGIEIADQGTHHACANNLVDMAGAATTGSYFSLNLPSSSYTLVDYNIGFGGASGMRWEEKAGTLAAWSSQSGLDPHSKKADPLFPNAAQTPDALVPQPGSPAVNAALASSAPADDYTGALRDNFPDIGACEFGSLTTTGTMAPGTCLHALKVAVLRGSLRMELPRSFSTESGRIRIFSIQGKLLRSVKVEKRSSIEFPWHAAGGMYIARARAGAQEWSRVFVDKQ